MQYSKRKSQNKLRSQKARRLQLVERLEERRLMAVDLVADMNNSNVAPAPQLGLVFEDVAYFANTDAFGSELWRSDGTEAGTYRLLDIATGAGSSNPSELLAFGDGFVFNASDSTSRGLWFSDGTANGTVKLKDRSYNCLAADVAGTLFFTDYNLGFFELWKSNGTVSGTELVKEFNGGFGSSFLGAGNKLFFTHNDGNSGSELWVSDGSAAGTLLVKHITRNGQGSYISSNSSYPSDFIEVGGNLFFTADEDNSGETPPSGSGRELWVSDGTAEGTYLLKDINPGVYDGPYS